MTDLISRQAAIDCVNRAVTKEVARWAIQELPFAEPERCEDCGNFNKTMLLIPQPEIIHCKDCEYWDTTLQNDWAKNWHYCPIVDRMRNGDWYCADAERRTDDSQ